MSVAQRLELAESTKSPLLMVAAERWPSWIRACPVLDRVGGLEFLRDWLRASQDPARPDAVLRALAELAATDGGDDEAAAAVLAWALLPGACTLAHQLRTLGPDIDALVASQLWIEIRTFPWRRLSKVAANILMNTRAGVLRESGAVSQLERVDRTWSRTSAVDPGAYSWPGYDATELVSELTPLEELVVVLSEACRAGVINPDDSTLLLLLVEAATLAPVRRIGRGHGGLMGNEVAEMVAHRSGLSVRTVRRRARRSMEALASAGQSGELASA
jgi:hypothetical protein